MAHRAKGYIGIAACLLASIAGCGGRSSADRPEAAAGPPATPVKLETIRPTTVRDFSDYVATLRSRHSADINPQVSGQITQIYVHSGDRVRAGAPLMQIDPLKQQATVASQQYATAAALANLRYAQQEYERTEKLYAAGVTSKQSYDQAKSALDAAQAQVDSLSAQVREQQVQLHYYKVLAPTDGIVGDIPVRVGDTVSQATLLTTVDQPGGLEAYIQVPVERGPELRLGEAVEILDESGKVTADGALDFISPQVDFTTQSILVKSRIPNPQGRLRTYQFARARIIWGSHPGARVPVLAVTRINGQYFTYVAEGSGSTLVAHQRQIQVGEMQGNEYVVKSGVAPGDRVIVSGIQNLIDGARVVPQK